MVWLAGCLVRGRGTGAALFLWSTFLDAVAAAAAASATGPLMPLGACVFFRRSKNLRWDLWCHNTVRKFEEGKGNVHEDQQ